MSPIQVNHCFQFCCYRKNIKFTIHSNEIFYLFTVVVGEDVEKPVVDGRRADALLAAHYAQEAALRLCKPGNEVISLKHYFEKVVKIIINSN